MSIQNKRFIKYNEYIFITKNVPFGTGENKKCQIETEQDLKEKDLEQEDKWETAKEQNLKKAEDLD
jgi:hypothetical protein